MNLFRSTAQVIVTSSAGFESFGRDFFWFFAHVRNFDALQNCFNAVVHFSQRLADVAAVALVALSADGDAGSDEQRAVDGANHFEGRNRVGGAGQRVSAVGAVLRLQQASLGQALQNLGQSLGRNAVGIGDILRAARARGGVLGEMLHRHQRVVGLFGEFQHALVLIPVSKSRLKESEINPTFSVVIHSTADRGTRARACREMPENGFNGKYQELNGLW